MQFSTRLPLVTTTAKGFVVLVLFLLLPVSSLTAAQVQPAAEEKVTTIERLEKILGLKTEKKKKKKKLKVRIEVRVEGVKDPLLKNIYQRLSIYRLRKNPRLNTFSVHQLYRRAEKEIRAAIAPWGWYNPTLISSIRRGEKGEAEWVVKFAVDRGEPVRIAALDLRSAGEGRHNRAINGAIALFALKKGAILNQELYEQEKKRLVNVAIAQGYLDAAFSIAEVKVDTVENSSSITLVLNTGKVYRFGATSLRTTPPDRFHYDLLKGYIPWKEGDPYSLGQLYELQSILYTTDYFREVNVDGHPELAVDGAIPVDVSLLMPEYANTYTVGAGYATNTGVRGQLKWKNRMFNTRGDRLGAELEIAQYEKHLIFTWDKPTEANPRYDHYIFNAAYKEQEWRDTSTRQLRALALREYSTPTFNLSGGVEMVDELYDIGSNSGHATLVMPTGSMGFIFADSLISPAWGIHPSGDARGAVEGMLSDASFFQWQLGAKAVATPIERWRLLGRVRFGATLVNSIDSIPASLRFYAGGDNSIRGYAYKSIGPTNSEGKVVGGRYLTVESIEIERLIGEYFGVAAFWDTGTATNDLSLDFHQGAGLGLRVRLPFGEIKLDVASAISEPGYPVRFHFSVGGEL